MLKMNTLKRSLNIRVFQMDDLKDYLEKMALKGWKLKKIGFRFVFDKIEPGRITYSVEFFDRNANRDVEPETAEKEFIQSCEVQGWKYIGFTGDLYVFISETENPVPLHKDRMEQYKGIKKNYKKSALFSWCLIPVVLLLLFIRGYSALITEYISLLCVCFVLYYTVTCLVDIFYYIKWCRKVKSNYTGPIRKIRMPEPIDLSRIVFSLIIILSVCFMSFYKDNKTENHNLPIALETIREDASSEKEYTFYERSTILASESWNSTENNKGIELEYKIFRSKSHFIIDLYVYDNVYGMFTEHYNSADPSAWGADAVYTDQNGDWNIVVFGDTVFSYEVDNIQIDSNDIDSIRKALGV